MQARAEHLVLWRAYVELEQARGDQKLTELRSLLASKQDELESRPEKVVDRWVDVDQLLDARAEAERAFQSRDRAYRTLIDIAIAHREVDGGRCRCGLALDRCVAAQAIAGYPGLLAWERRQIERSRRDQPHQLPDNHPALLDRRRTERQDEWVRLVVVYEGPVRLIDALLQELWERMVDVDEDDGRHAGETWTVPVTGTEEAISEALSAFGQRHPRTRVRIQGPAA